MRVFFFFRSFLDIIIMSLCLDNTTSLYPFLARKRAFLCRFLRFSCALSPAKSGDHFIVGMFGNGYPVKG